MKKKSVDCVVIGTGMGGTTMAALLAHHGYNVLVLEKRNFVGGRFSTMEIDGFKCPTGALMVMRGTELEKTFKLTGAKFEVTECSNIYWMINNKFYCLLGSFPDMMKTLFSALTGFRWTHWRFNFWHTMRTMRSFADLIARKFFNIFRGIDNPVRKKPTVGGLSYRDWMEMHNGDNTTMEACHAIVSSLFTATNDYECPAEDVFEFWASMANPAKIKKFGYSTKGNIVLIQNLLDTVKKKGGEVITEAEVKKIKMERGRAVGVIVSTKDGEIDVDAKIVVSNSGVTKTIELVGEKHFPIQHVREVKDRIRPIPIVMGLIASDVPLLDKPGLTVVVGTHAIVTGVTVTLASNELAPKGQHLLWTCATPKQCFDHIDPQEEIRRNEEDVRKAFPLFEKHGRVLKWVIKDIDDDLPCMRTWPGYDMPVTTPIYNLFNVGDSVKDPGWTGSPACARSAWQVMKIIRKRYPLMKIRQR